jgi:hypothetical protein
VKLLQRKLPSVGELRRRNLWPRGPLRASGALAPDLRFGVQQGDDERASRTMEAAVLGVHQRRPWLAGAIFGVLSHSKPTISSAISPLREDFPRPRSRKQRYRRPKWQSPRRR